MNLQKALPIGIVVVLAAIALWWGPMLLQNTTPSTSTTKTYTAPNGELTFAYPARYALESRADSFEQTPITVLTLLPADAVIPDMSEGPPGISVLIVPNSGDLFLDEWVRTKSISNFALSNGTLASTTLADEAALSYQHSGLYENDVVAAQHNGIIYLFIGSWSGAQDQIRADFQTLLNTVEFN